MGESHQVQLKMNKERKRMTLLTSVESVRTGQGRDDRVRMKGGMPAPENIESCLIGVPDVILGHQMNSPFKIALLQCGGGASSQRHPRQL